MRSLGDPSRVVVTPPACHPRVLASLVPRVIERRPLRGLGVARPLGFMKMKDDGVVTFSIK